MNSHSKLLSVALILGAMIGCGAEEGPGPATSTPPPANTAVKPLPEPAKKSQDMVPPPAKDEANKADAAKKDEPPAIEGPKSENAAPGTIKLGEEEIANIKKLPEAEQAVALKQVVCPVSGEPLGAMGMPKKATIDARTFYLCCGSCQDTVKSDPKSVLAKLDQK